MEEDTLTLTTCPACGAENDDAATLGQLGRLLWFRCRYCGMDYSHKVDQ